MIEDLPLRFHGMIVMFIGLDSPKNRINCCVVELLNAMNGNKIVILHIICDSIFFDKLFPLFERMEGYENRYLFKGLIADNTQFAYIKNSEKVICASTLKEWGDVVGDPQNDIIYFEGLWKDSLKAVDFIREEAIVMWWCMGQEIYGNEYGWAPLMSLKIYKLKTLFFVLRHSKTLRSFISKSLTWVFPQLYDTMQDIRYRIQGKRYIHKEMLGRIDYAFTPLPIELDELKKRHPYIKAKPYKLGATAQPWPFEYQKKVGHILFDHSAMSNNNHLDLLPITKKLHLTGRNIYVPLSYGNDDIAGYMLKHASFEGANTHFLTEVIPGKDYLQLVSNCSHALFGTIRQSGLGNANIMLRKGVKMFYFEDSIMYKQLKSDGYYVFSIEKDLNDDSIREPLSDEMALHNYNLFYKIHGTSCESYQQQFDRILASRWQQN